MKTLTNIITIIAYVLLFPLFIADVCKTAYSWRSAKFFDVARFCFGAWCHTINKIIISFNFFIWIS